MARRKLSQRNVRNIQRSHGTYYVNIPIELMRSLRWRERQKVVVKLQGKSKILISDWKK
jgi:antitoxin component of MazEF toxin-antitoxin module